MEIRLPSVVSAAATFHGDRVVPFDAILNPGSNKSILIFLMRFHVPINLYYFILIPRIKKNLKFKFEKKGFDLLRSSSFRQVGVFYPSMLFEKK